MALSLRKAFATSLRPNLLVIEFSKAVLQQNPSASNDSLHLANYVITNPLGATIPIDSVQAATSRVVLLTLSVDQGESTIYTVSVNNVESSDGDVLPGNAQTVTGIGASIDFTPGVATIGSFYAQDSFNRANSGTLGTADSGQTWIGADTALFGVDTNHAKHLAGGTQPNRFNAVNATHADGTVQITYVTVGGDSGVAFRCKNVETGTPSGFLVVVTGGQTKLFRTPDGVSYVQIGAGTSLVDGDVAKVTLSGANIEVFKNGSSIISVSDSFNQTETEFGLYASSGDTPAGVFDSFSVGP